MGAGKFPIDNPWSSCQERPDLRLRRLLATGEGSIMGIRRCAGAAGCVLVIAVAAHARPQFARNCNACHGGGPLVATAPEVINFDGFADPDESATGAADRGLLKVFTVEPGGTVDLQLLVDLEDALNARFAVELKRMEEPGVVNGGTLVFDADPDWNLQIGTDIVDPTRPYYTFPQDQGIEYAGPQVFTFTMGIDETTPADFYDLEFALAGQPGFHYNDEHFYLQVIPEPGTLALIVLGAAVGMTRRRRRAIGAISAQPT